MPQQREDQVAWLNSDQPVRPFFVGIDSDGCVFDSMDLKQKECFCPAFIREFGLQPVARFAREVWEYVTLASADRGANRFLVLLKALACLAERREVRERGFKVPELRQLEGWVGQETCLSNATLQRELMRHPSRELETVYNWSEAVNLAVSRMVINLPPLPGARAALKQIAARADVLIVSQAPVDELSREWAEHKLDALVGGIAGQEAGSKSEQLRRAAVGKYPPQHILMIGDAPGDYMAAHSQGALFYPIDPGGEAESWQRLCNEDLERFFNGRYAGAYMQERLWKFNGRLAGTPPWAAKHKD